MAKKTLFLTVLFSFIILLRFVFPTADPASFQETDVSWNDEGCIQNARNMVLFGKWRLNESNPMYFSPVFTFLIFISFKLFGVSTFSARAVSMLLGTFSVLLLYQFVKSAYDFKTAIISCVFLGVNYFYLMYNRVAMLETTMIFFMILAVFLYQKGTKFKFCYFLSAFSLIIAYFTKASAAFLIVVFLLFFIFKGWANKERLIKSLTSKEVLLFILGLSISICLWLTLWLLPNLGEYLKYNVNLYVNRNLNFNLSSVALQLAILPSANNFFISMPVISILSSLTAFSIFLSLIFKNKNIKEYDILLLLWVVIGIFQISLTGAFARRILFLLPAMTILAARSFSYPFSKIKQEDNKKVGFFWRIVILGICFYLSFAIAMAFVGFGNLEHKRILISLFLIIPVFFILMKNKYIIIRLLGQISKSKVVYFLVLACFVINGGRFYIWARDRSYLVINASREIGKILPEGTKVQGSLANALSLENKIIPYSISDGYDNFADMLNREDIKYILTSEEPYLGSENRAMQKLVNAYPNSRVIKKFDLHKAKGENVSVVLLEKHK